MTMRLFACAALAAHAVHHQKGFRQKDLKFFCDLFLDWVSCYYQNQAPDIHNNQIRRYLAKLKEDGFVTSKGKGKSEYFELTRAGLLDQIHKTFALPCLPLELFLFIYYFAMSYREKLKGLIREKGFQMPHALEIELEALTDPKHLLYTQTRYYEQEIEKLELSAADTKKASELAKKMHEQNRPIAEIALAIEKNYPYELNPQKNLSELLLELPMEMQYDEMERGNLYRANILWMPMVLHLKHSKRLLEQVANLSLKSL